MEGSGGAGCMLGWRGLGVEGVWWSWWDGGVWCWGCRVYGGFGGMEGSGAGVQGVWWFW